MLIMSVEMDVMCCKSVGTDLSMLDIDDFITEISQLKKEVALLEAKLRSRGDEEVKRENVDVVCRVTSTECLDSVWISSRDQSRTPQPLLEKLSEEKPSLTLLCYTESDDQDTTVCDSNQGLKHEESTDQTSTESLDSVCNAGGQQQILQTTLKMCSVKLMDCRNLMMKIKTEPTEEEHHTNEEDNHDDDDDFIPSDVKSDSCPDGETSSTTKARLTAQTLSCITCGKTFSSQRHLEKHERKQHAEQKRFTSTRSKISFNTLQEKKLHSEEHRQKKKKQQFHCEQCGKNYFTTKSNINAHMKIHSEQKLQCSHCDKRFSQKRQLIAHETVHTGDKPYICSYCGKSFSKPAHFRVHLRLHTGEKPYLCNVCGKSFNQCNILASHQRIHTGEKPFKCSQCDKAFTQLANLTTHQRLHTGEKPYLCSICGKRFACSSQYKVHQRVHTGEKPYHCSVCGKSFNQCENLVSHQRTHTGEKPFQCSQCEKTFAHSGTLKSHQRVHTGEKPFHCSICGERFTHLGSLKFHQKKHTEEQTPLKSS